MTVEEQVNKYYQDLTPNDRYIWSFISSHRQEAVEMTLSVLALKCNAARSSIVRFTQKLSYQGYSEFRYALKQEITAQTLEPNAIEKYTTIVSSTLENLLNHDLTSVIELMLKSKKIFLYGTGNLQRLVAQEMRRLFLAENVTLFVVEGVDEIQALTHTLTTEDLVFLISLHGESDNAVSFANGLRANGIPFVSVTSHIDNDIARLADESIFVNTGTLIGNQGHNVEISDGFFLLVSILFIRYREYKQQQRHIDQY